MVFAVVLFTPRLDRAVAQETRPNVLLILLDNIGKDWFRCYGSQEDVTPNIDRLARTGVKFRNFYTTPVCSTTRVALLTGRYPFRTGWHTHHDPAIYGGGYFDWETETCLARVMKAAGYRTYIAGKWQINDLFDPVQAEAIGKHGFDEYCLFPEGKKGHPAHKQRYWAPYIIENGTRLPAKGMYGPQVFTDRLIDFMRRTSRDNEQPFFAYYSAILTHLSLGNTPDNRDQTLSDREQFAGMAQYADKMVGRMIDALEELSIRDRTVVILLCDNGTDNGAYHGYDELGGRFAGRIAKVGSTMKPKENGYYPMTEWGINMPLIVNCPGRIPGGRESDELTDLSCLFPTVAEFAGASDLDQLNLDGTSLLTHLRGGSSTTSRTHCFSQYAGLRVVRNQRFKLFSDGRFFDLSEDPLERFDLQKTSRLRDDDATRRAHKELRTVLEQLPADHELPWEFRSISARAIQAAKSADNN